ncbi:hypothetical protein EC973_007773 [Apophysomyces ossiformis]|uniref:Uncharacterized protein n=1 Tax=Apophysomyces ossiformis TaxID=679940 RepID=A0A8H7EUF3_9FUNG|nr:hypothetical protein EC973_007773 [Apophysomyces ossiformis]
MAIGGVPSMNKQTPLLRDKSRPGDEEWPNERVVGWLEESGWNYAARRFRDYNVQGQKFFDLTIEELNDLLPRFRDDEKKLLLHNIRTLRTNVLATKYEEMTTTPTSMYDEHPFRDPPENAAYQQSMQARPNPSMTPWNLGPYHAPVRQQQNGTLEYDGGPQTLHIPQRTSSSSGIVSELMEQIQAPQFKPLAGKPRLRSSNPYPSNPSAANGRYPGNVGVNMFPAASDRIRSPNSPRNIVDPEKGWKVAGRVPVVSAPAAAPSTPPVPVMHEHPIQVTKDSDVYFRLIVTDSSDAQHIKYLILKKMGLEVSGVKYQFFHENGSRADLALSDDELLRVCRNSDDSITKRILVKALDTSAENYNDYPLQSSPHPFRPSYPRSQPSYGTPSDVLASVAWQPPSNDTYDISTQAAGYLQPDRASPISTSGGYQLTDPPAPQLDNTAHCQFEQQQPLGTLVDEYRYDSGYFEKTFKRSSNRSVASSDYQVFSDQTGTPPSSVQTELRVIPPQTNPTEKPKPLESLWAVAPRPQASLSEQTNEPFTEPPHASKSTPVLNSVSRPQSTSSEKSSGVVNETLPVVSYWAIPPRPQSSASDRTDGSFAETPRSTKAATPVVSYWAVPPRSQPVTDDELTPTEATASNYYQPAKQPLWSIEEQSLPNNNLEVPRSPLSAALSVEEGVEKLSLSDPREGNANSGLHIQIPSRTSPGPSSARSQHSPRTPLGEPRTPQSAISIPSPICSQETPDSDYNDWAERPPVEKLYRDIDKYLPGHDLDGEIVIETPSLPATTPASRRLQGRKKSVRIMMKEKEADEARHKWKLATNMIKINRAMSRQRSTKMWGRKVEQVKPGMTVEKVVQATLQPGDMPEPTKMQWMRGELIGKGSFGRVYHAWNVATSEWIAVKQVDLPTSTSDLSNPELREQVDSIYREITLLAPLNHDNVVQYLGYHSDEEEGHLYIFLEYVPGGSIASMLSKYGAFGERLVRFFTRQILLGLEYLHGCNILHRDIKAGNILLDLDGICKITDFGLSKLGGQHKAYDPYAQNSVMRGTVFWMAPEVVKGTNYSAKIDIWSIGCTVIEMLTGKHPWLDLNMLAALYHLGQYQAPPIPQDISSEAEDFLKQCFTINPVDRPTASELLSHPFVQQDSTFNFNEYMQRKGFERKSSRRAKQ